MLRGEGLVGTEYAARNQDGEWATRVSRPGELYPAHKWARHQQALGAQVFQRWIIVLDDSAEMPLHENA